MEVAPNKCDLLLEIPKKGIEYIEGALCDSLVPSKRRRPKYPVHHQDGLEYEQEEDLLDEDLSREYWPQLGLALAYATTPLEHNRKSCS